MNPPPPCQLNGMRVRKKSATPSRERGEQPALAGALACEEEEEERENGERRVEEEAGVPADEEVEEIRRQAMVDLGETEDPGPRVARPDLLLDLLGIRLRARDRQLGHDREVEHPDAGAFDRPGRLTDGR